MEPSTLKACIALFILAFSFGTKAGRQIMGLLFGIVVGIAALVMATAIMSEMAEANDRVFTENCSAYTRLTENEQSMIVLGYFEGVWILTEEYSTAETISEALVEDSKAIRKVADAMKKDCYSYLSNYENGNVFQMLGFFLIMLLNEAEGENT